MNKRGFELSLHAVVDLVLAAMAIVAITSIISVVLFSLYSEENNAQDSGFLRIKDAIERNEASGIESEKKPAIGFLKDNFIFVAFSKGEDNIEGVCTHKGLKEKTDKGPFAILSHVSEDILIKANRPEKCDPQKNPACLCLCKFKRDATGEVNLNCVEGMCYIFRDNPDLQFEGGENCDTPIIYRNDNDLYNYCLVWDGQNIVFREGSC
ncbi:MAG: hypothetical protein ACQESF_00240 [Nanobdellota archaeon]